MMVLKGTKRKRQKQMIKFYKHNKWLFCVTFFSTLFVHLIKLVNYYPTWDSVPAIIKPFQAMMGYGRWFSGTLANVTSSPYDLQWLEGVVAAMFISLSMVLFVKLFEIQKKEYQFLCVASFVTLPCVTATFAYQNWASAYMCALFFAILAVYLCVAKTWNSAGTILCATVLFALSLGTYQIYYTFALLLFLFYIFKKLFCKQNTLFDMKREFLHFGVSFISGGLLYWIINKVVLQVIQVELSDYQGISSIHFPSLREIFSAFISSFRSFIEFFKGNFSFFNGDITIFSFYPLINALIFGLLAGCIIKFVIANKSIKIFHKIVMLVILAVMVPITYAFTFTSTGVVYHRLMEFGNYFVYFLPILFLQHAKFRFKKVQKIIAVSLVMISLYNFMNANVAYHQMSISYEKTYFQNIEMASMIDAVADQENPVVAVIGKQNNNEHKLVANPDITGATTAVFTISQRHNLRYCNYYLGRNYHMCNEETITEIMKEEAFQTMPDFPSKGSVKLIDGVVVVKLSDEK